MAEGLCEPKAVTQTEAYAAGVLWARTEGFIPAPETTNALAQVVKEARQAKEEGREKTIVVNWSGHGLLDLGAYDRYFTGELNDVAMSDEDLAAISGRVCRLPEAAGHEEHPVEPRTGDIPGRKAVFSSPGSIFLITGVHPAHTTA